MELCELLHNLQKYDNAIASQKAECSKLESRVREIGASAAADSSAIAALEERLKSNVHAVAEAEKEVAFIDSQIEKLSTRFLMIKNEKELSKYNSEMEKHKSDKSRAEETELKRMDEGEKLTAELSAKKNEAVLRKKTFETELADLEARIANQKAELEKLAESRRKFCGGIPAEALGVYDRIYKAKNGRAVSDVSNKVCSGCQLTVPDSTLARARTKTSVVTCPNCQRILFVAF